MADENFDTLELVGRHVPDYSTETHSDGSKYQVELPGMYEVGFVKDGVFRAIYTLKAASLLSDIAAAKESDQSDESQGDQAKK